MKKAPGRSAASSVRIHEAARLRAEGDVDAQDVGHALRRRAASGRC